MLSKKLKNSVMKKITLFIAMFITFFHQFFSQKELDTYLKLAAENNPSLKKAFNEYRASLEKISSAKSLPDPQIMFQYFITPLVYEMGKQRFSISASQMFPWFGQLSAQEQYASEIAKSKYYAFINERNHLFFNIKKTYYNLYLNHKAISIVHENIKILNTIKELAKINFENGKNSLADVLRIEIELAKLETELANLKDNQYTLIKEFEKYINKKIDHSISFPDTLWEDTLSISKSTLLDSVFSHHPLLFQKENEILSYAKQINIAKKMSYPAFSIGLNYMNMSKKAGNIPDNGKDMFMPEIGMSLPIYRKKYHSMIKEAKFMQEASLFEKENLKNDLSYELEKSYFEYLSNKRNINLYKKLYKLAKDARQILLTSYSTGNTSLEEVLKMHEEEISYALQLEQARVSLNITTAYINYLTGKP